MSDPSTWGERRRRREQERHLQATGQIPIPDVDGPAAPVPPAEPAPEPAPERDAEVAGPPLTRRQLREARRKAGQPAAQPAVQPAELTASRIPVVRPGVPVRRPEDPQESTDPSEATGTLPPMDWPAPRGAVLPTDRQPRRRRWVWVLAAIAVVALVAAAAFIAVRGNRPGGAAADDPGAASGPTMRTAVLSLAKQGSVVGAELFGVGGSSTAGLLVPSALLVDVAGGGRVPLAESLAVGDDAPAQAVADALNLRVDGSWVLTTDGLAALVDAVGGITVDVDVEIRSGDVHLVPGPGQPLDGAQAVAFATFAGPGEAEAVRLARLDAVLAQLLESLPTDPGQVAALLADLGDASRTTFEPDALAELVATAAGHAASGSFGASVLPVTEISTGGDTVLYGVNDEAAAKVVASRFAAARREGGQEAARVLVQNGVGTPGLGDSARDLLVEAGFRFVGGGNARTLGQPTSAVLVPSNSTADRELGLAVAEALGLPTDVVAVGQEAPTTAEVVVVLGADFAERAQQTP